MTSVRSPPTVNAKATFDPIKMSSGAAKACPDPENHVFWDGNHPTAWVNKVLADEWTRQVKLGLSAQPGVYLQARD